MICKTMGVLPSNPDFINLTFNQIQWLKENISYDIKLENEAYKKISKGSKDNSEEYVEEEVDDYSEEDMIAIMEQRRNKRG